MLEFTKNGISYELYFNKENIIEYWLDSLKPICVFTKLETYYIPIHYFEDNYSFSSVREFRLFSSLITPIDLHWKT